MNSERRHELQQNILASYLGRLNQSIEPYSRIIAVVVAVVVVGAITIALISSKKSADQSDATLRLIQAVSNQDPEVLEQVGLDFPDTSAGAWSRLYQGDELLAAGIRTLFTSREEALETLDQSKVAFEEALASSDDPLLRSRANFGIGRASESRGEVEDAIAAYEACIAVNESKAMVEKAQERINSLSSPETKEFLAWFSKQDFSPPAEPSLPPALPEIDSIPGVSDIKLPKIDGASDRELGGDFKMPEVGQGESPEAKDGAGGDTDAKDGDGEAKDGDAEVEGGDAEAKEGDSETAAKETEDASAEAAAPDPAESEDGTSTDTKPGGEDTAEEPAPVEESSGSEETTEQEKPAENDDKSSEGDGDRDQE